MALYEFIHRQGASCMIGTSRNLDLRVTTRQVPDIKALEPDNRDFLRRGADLMETDIPTLLGPLLQGAAPVGVDIDAWGRVPLGVFCRPRATCLSTTSTFRNQAATWPQRRAPTSTSAIPRRAIR